MNEHEPLVHESPSLDGRLLSGEVDVLDAAIAFVDEFYGEDDVAARSSSSSNSDSNSTRRGDGASEREPQAAGKQRMAIGTGVDVDVDVDVGSLRLMSEECDDVENVTTKMGGMIAPQEQTAALPEKPKRRNKRREELLYLRDKVKDLEHELALLAERHKGDGTKRRATTQASRAVTVCMPQCARDSESRTTVSAVPLMTSLWQGVLERQVELRRSVECENMALRSMLEDQLTVARSLERILKKRSVAELMSSEKSPAMKRLRLSGPVQTLLDDPSVVGALKDGFEGMYERLSSITADPRFQCTEVPHQVTELRYDEATGGTSVEAVGIRVVPFAFQMTAKAAWEQAMSQEFTNQQVVTESEDVFLKAFIAKFALRDGNWEIHVAMRARRIIESDRVVCLSTIIMQPTVAPGMDTCNTVVHYKCWHIITPLDGPEPATLVQTFRVATPVVCGDGLRQHEKVGTLTNMVLQMIPIQLNSRLQLLENVLLERTATATTSD